MRHLNTAVVAGGVVYPAGTAATPELEALVPDPAHWAGEESACACEPTVPVKPAEPETPVDQDKPRPARKWAAKKPTED